MSLQLAKYQQMFDSVKDDIAVKEMVKMIFMEKQIDIAKAKKSTQYTCLWDLLPYDCQENVLSHKQDIEWGYLYGEYGKYPMTTIKRWLSANHVSVKLKAGHTIPLLWSMINRKSLNHAIADYALRNEFEWEKRRGEKMKEKLIADGVENIGYEHEVYGDISLDSLKEYRSEELAKSKVKRDAKRKAQAKKPQQPTLAVGTLIATQLGAYTSGYTFLIIRGETKTKYRVEKISNQTNQEENIGGIGYGGYRDTTRCPKVGQTYEKHSNISKKMSEYALRDLTECMRDTGDYYQAVYENVWSD
jgi:hypothetical protein